MCRSGLGNIPRIKGQSQIKNKPLVRVNVFMRANLSFTHSMDRLEALKVGGPLLGQLHQRVVVEYHPWGAIDLLALSRALS